MLHENENEYMPKHVRNMLHATWHVHEMRHAACHPHRLMGTTFFSATRVQRHVGLLQRRSNYLKAHCPINTCTCEHGFAWIRMDSHGCVHAKHEIMSNAPPWGTSCFVLSVERIREIQCASDIDHGLPPHLCAPGHERSSGSDPSVTF